MGAGIAQLAAAAGARTLLHDPVDDARERGLAQIADGLERWRCARAASSASPGAVAAVEELGGLADCGLVIEAAPERLELKRELFAAAERDRARRRAGLEHLVDPDHRDRRRGGRPRRASSACTSSTRAPVMRLVEVIAGIDSSPEALDVARATGRGDGQGASSTPTDGPGLPGQPLQPALRPRGAEAPAGARGRRRDDRRASRARRGFRMGPFELQDLVGIDVGYEVSLSFHELSFGEPRWRPSPLSARMVAAGRLGPQERPRLVRVPARARRGPGRRRRPGGGDGRLVVVAGEVAVADELRALARAGRLRRARARTSAEGEVPVAARSTAGADPEGPPLQGGPVALLCADGSLHALDGGGGAVGFHVLPPLEGAPLVELTRGAGTAALAAERAEAFFAALGLRTRVGRRRAGARARAHRVPSSSTRRASPSARASARARTSTPGWCSASTTRAGRSPGARRSAPSTCSPSSTRCAIELGEERYRAAPLLRRLATLSARRRRISRITRG